MDEGFDKISLEDKGSNRSKVRGANSSDVMGGRCRASFSWNDSWNCRWDDMETNPDMHEGSLHQLAVGKEYMDALLVS